MCVFSDDFGSYSIFSSKVLSMKQSMYIELCVEIQGEKMLTLIGGLCCVGLVHPVGVGCVWKERERD
jgi:hypothetical protein